MRLRLAELASTATLSRASDGKNDCTGLVPKKSLIALIAVSLGNVAGDEQIFDNKSGMEREATILSRITC